MITFEHITKKYNSVFALNDVAIQFAKCQSIALIGPNGSGKTTLIKSILGMVIPQSGKITFNGKDIATQWHYRNEIGYMSQIVNYPGNTSVNQLIEMMKDIRNRYENLDEELLESFDIKSIGNKNLKSLSGGTKQKVNACLAFLFNPSVYILDEPTSGLDPLSSEILKQKILKEKEKGKLIIISSHILADLEELTTDILYLLDGAVYFYLPLSEIYISTNEKKLSKAIAKLLIEKKYR